jgi:hypothetical protein
MKNGWEWEYKPHPKILPQYLDVIATVAAIVHIDKNMV